MDNYRPAQATEYTPRADTPLELTLKVEADEYSPQIQKPQGLSAQRLWLHYPAKSDGGTPAFSGFSSSVGPSTSSAEVLTVRIQNCPRIIVYPRKDAVLKHRQDNVTRDIH
jgi:hypothetical protein